jgi:hypothetical protein
MYGFTRRHREVSRWLEHLLHNQTALRLEAALLFHPGIVITNVPYHMATRNLA